MSISSAGNKLEELFFSSKKRFLGTLAGLVMLLAIPVTMSLINQQQDIRQRAAECNMIVDILHCGSDPSMVYVKNHIDCIDRPSPCTPTGSTCQTVTGSGNVQATCVGGTTLPTATTAPATGNAATAPIPTPTINCSPGTSYCENIGAPPGSNCTQWPYANCQACLPLLIVACTPAAAPGAPAAPGTSTIPVGCAQFSQWCNSDGTSCSFAPLRGTANCTVTITSYFRTCLNYSYDPTTTIQTICTAPVATVAPTAIATPTTIPGATATATPTLGAGITLSFSIILPGIGNTSALGLNTSPARTPSFTVQVGTTTFPTPLTFSGGVFTGNVNLPNITPGAYAIKIKSDNSLYKAVPGTTMTLTNGGNVVPQMTLVTGNVNDTGTSQNKIDLQDYNYLISCYNGIPCNTTIKADLNLDGTVDSKDLNILLRAFATPNGD